MLQDDQLEDISGGVVTIGTYHFSGRVGMRSGVVGRNCYMVKNDGSTWYYGQLLESHDVTFVGRIHIVHCSLKDGEYFGDNMQLGGDNYTLYTKMTQD